MEAKDTIMNLEQMNKAILTHLDLPMGQAIAIEQAELTFPAGVNEGIRKTMDAADSTFSSLLKEERKAGERAGYETGREYAEMKFNFNIRPRLEAEARKAGIEEVMEQPHLDGKCTGDFECFCMIKLGECDDPHNKKHFPKVRMYPDDIAEGEGRLIFVSKAKLKEWGRE